ncbi:MAG: Calx-beta domain-containing protein [Geminicoccaceae bacterium]
MTIDQPQPPMLKTGHQDAVNERSAPRGGWKIKERRAPAKSKPEQHGGENAEQQGSSKTRTASMPERKPVTGPPSASAVDNPLKLEKRRSFLRPFLLSKGRLSVSLALGAVAIAVILAPSWDQVERWFGGEIGFDRLNQESVAEDVSAHNPNLLVRAVALPALEDEGVLPVYFRISEAADSPIEIAYKTEAHTAEADTDFVSTAGSLTIQPGEILVELHIPLIDDDAIETAELFRVILSVDPKLATLDDKELTATVLDDDYKK